MDTNSRIPMLLSAFVCPGAGQFMQKRWMAGVIYAVGFIIGFCWFMVLAVKIIIDYYRIAFDANFQPENPDIMAMLPPFLIAMAFYVLNLIDVFLAQQSFARRKRKEAL